MTRFLCASLLLSIFLLNTQADQVPDDLVLTRFSGPDVTPSPACLCASADGSVYVGVDLNGSLGKGPGRGTIVKLIDSDHDGVADSHTEYAKIDNARGLIAAGDKLYVLHTAYGTEKNEEGIPLSTGMDLVVLTDADEDGIADGAAKPLVKRICSAHSVNDRGTDHATNGIQLGIDGWIYIAVGDFGFADAEGTDGTKLTHLGGGIARVRPDGTELEMYTSGMRNIYDVAIDPFMNIFTRGNTNDGGGWNVRFNHHIQSGEYGYPRLFVNFADEIIPALEDLGGGSGAGALFLDEPTWPKKYNREPLMADWGRKAVYLHRLTKDGPTFQQSPEEFIQISQVSDLDVDPSGQMFVSAWDGAGFKGSDQKGYTVRIVPKGWVYKAPADLQTASVAELVALIGSDSDKTRIYAQQELLTRSDAEQSVDGLKAIFTDEKHDMEGRVAAFYTWSQIETDPAKILAYHDDKGLREFALRAATDRLPRLEMDGLTLEPFVSALNDGSPREKAAAAIALGRLGDKDAAEALLAVDYTKPEPEGAARITQFDTLKNTRTAEHELHVAPGEKVYLNLSETNPVEEASQLAFLDPVFELGDGSFVSLVDLKPVSGEVFVNAGPKGEKIAKKQKKKAKAIVVAKAPGTLVYEAPANAVKFHTKVQTSSTGPKDGSVDFFASTVSPEEAKDGVAATPRHATPNSNVILPHLAVQTLVKLGAVDACLNAVGTSSEDLALWALSRMHSEKAVYGLVDRLAEAKGEQRQPILTVLARLYQEEAPYDGSWWWTTRPDTRGPYYKPITWKGSPVILTAMVDELADTDEKGKAFLAGLNDRMRMGIDDLGTLIAEEEMEQTPTVDLAKIRAQKGAVGSTPVEDVLLSIDKIEGDPKVGEKLFTQQGCVACHALQTGGPSLGPFMGQIGSIMNREQIATAILRPNDTISQGFQTAQIQMKDGTIHVGFVTESNSDRIVMRDMASQVKTIKAADVEKEEHLPTSMMPTGLANALSLEEFVSLVDFLAGKKG